MSKTLPREKELFDSLVKNGLDFLKVSVEELEVRPKYSVIHFCSGVEILLKARLLQEHWSLIVGNEKSMRFHLLKNGQALTIGMDETINRIESVIETTISPEARDSFKQIKDHRNRNIHFFPIDGNQNLQTIVSEQLKSWYFLHRLLISDWNKNFGDYKEEIEAINKLLLQNNRFLAEKFEILSKKDIPNLRKNGKKIITCKACEYDASVITEDNLPDIDCECLVCEANLYLLGLACSTCDTVNYFNSEDNIATTVCANCQNIFSVTDLAEQGFTTSQIIAASFTLEQIVKSGRFNTENILTELVETATDLDDITSAYCRNCKYDLSRSVIPVYDEWICVECLKKYNNNNITVCEWCGEPIAGFIEEDTSAFGCGINECRGSVGYQISKDD